MNVECRKRPIGLNGRDLCHVSPYSRACTLSCVTDASGVRIIIDGSSGAPPATKMLCGLNGSGNMPHGPLSRSAALCTKSSRLMAATLPTSRATISSRLGTPFRRGEQRFSVCHGHGVTRQKVQTRAYHTGTPPWRIPRAPLSRTRPHLPVIGAVGRAIYMILASYAGAAPHESQPAGFACG